MQKLVDFISKGKGFGLRGLVVFCAFWSLIFSFFLKYHLNVFAPSLQEAVSQILPLKVEEGQVLAPKEEKTIRLKLSDKLPELSVPFFVNTGTDVLETKDLEPGFYMTRTAFYTVNQNKVEMTKLSGSFEIPQGDYTPFFKKFATWLAVAAWLVLFPLTFVCFLLLALILTLFALVLLRIFNKQASFDARMRLSVCGILLMYSLKYLAGLLQITAPSFLFLVLIVIFQAIFIYKGAFEDKLSQN